MSAQIPAPSLSTQGWITDPSEKLDALLSWFFLSEQNQSQLYFNEVISLPKIIQQYNNDAIKIADAIKEKLTNYLNGYFERVEVKMTITDNAIDASKVDLSLSIELLESQRSSVHQRLLKIENSKMQSIVKLNNN